MGALRSCAEQGAAVLLVTHDTAVAGACDERYTLDAGRSTAPRKNVREESLG
jgi:putative ABC transport system ATP-binding protein